MSNREDKEKNRLLRQQQETLNREAAGDRTALRTDTPLETMQSDEATGYFNFLKDPNFNVTKIPGLDTSGMIEEGEAGAAEERTALGASRFGASAVDPGLQAVIAATLKDRKSQRRGKALEGAFQSHDLKMRQLADAVISRTNQKKAASVGVSTPASSAALQNYAQFQPRPHWGLGLATAGIAGLGQAFSGRL